MSPAERDAIMAICLMAALSDGGKDEAERAKLKEIFSILEADGGAPVEVYQRVLLKKTSPAAEAQALGSAETRMLAYEMAVCVCDADGVTNPAERAFLDDLRRVLGLTGAEPARVLDEAESLAAAPPDTPESSSATLPVPTAAAGAAGAAGTGAGAAAAISAETDGMILRYSILTAALELLPQSLATLAIVPLQTKMVYRIGAKYGYTLDAGHIKEFIATVGLGLTSQVVENFARKLIGKFAKKAGGKLAGKAGSAVTGAAVTFAATYALGKVAQAYYSGGRSLAGADLKALFQKQAEQARGLYAQHASAIEQQAGSLDMGKVLSMVRGQGA
ncbi:MAG: DUF533 domain-containing protein [Candidatus Sumerlaeaceae bacterium]|nr:DUF533 domain-containing protein [Candidatus Sumerlaeaceae bacterium]